MTIGIAIVVAMILYLIDRNKVWKQAAKIGVALILLAVLGVGGIVGWDKYDAWIRARKEAATQRENAASCAAMGIPQPPDGSRCIDFAPYAEATPRKAEAEAQSKYCAVLKDYIRLAGDGHPNTLPADFFTRKDDYEQNCKPTGAELPTCAEYEKQHKISPPPSGYKITDAKGVALCR